jgi:hypothetical protein
MKVWRWVFPDIASPVRSRSLPWTFMSRVTSAGAGDIGVFFIDAESVRRVFFAQEREEKRSYLQQEVFRRAVDTPSSLANRTSSATVQEVEDASLEANFVRTVAPVLAEIGRMAQLEDGWDSHGGSAINRETRETAVRFLRMLYPSKSDLPLPVVGPTASGGVVFQWWLHDREVAAEVAPDSFRYYAAHPDEDRMRVQSILPPDQLRELAFAVGRLLGEPMAD